MWGPESFGCLVCRGQDKKEETRRNRRGRRKERQARQRETRQGSTRSGAARALKDSRWRGPRLVKCVVFPAALYVEVWITKEVK